MNRRNRLLAAAAGVCITLFFLSAEEITVQASEKEGYDFFGVGVAEVLDPSAISNEQPVEEQEELNIYQKF